MKRAIVMLLTATAAFALVACGGDKKTLPGGTTSTTGTGGHLYGIGSIEFVSKSPSYGGGGHSVPGTANDGAEGGNGTGGAATGTSGGTGTAGGTGGSGSSSTRDIQEADIYKVAGNTLYVLNQYRGLQIIDVSDTSHPALLAKVPVVGTPKDLYVEGNIAYVVVSDSFYYGWGPYMNGGGVADGDAAMATPWIGSQVWAVDVTTPAQPVVLSKLPVDGEVDESRIVGNVLYVVSNVWGWYEWDWTQDYQTLTYVQSFDLTDPAKLKSVQRIDFPADGWTFHANVTESRIVLSESGWDYDADAGTDSPITQFTPIDITDPAGAMALGTPFTTEGQVQDRWALDYDATTQLFRAVLQNDWGNSGGSLQIWREPDVNTATHVGSLALNVAESITAASFDGPRAYIVSAYCTDPLWIIDTSNPAQPVVKGSVQMSGALDFILPRGNQLLALGHDSDGCMAWEGTGQLAVSLFDVTDPTQPTMLSRVDFGQQYSYLNVSNDDFRKAFQVLDDQGLILVPFQSWDSTNWTYAGGTQLIDLGTNALTLRGFAEHAGSIERAFPVQDKLAALSDRSLQILDATNRDQPTTVASLDLARPVISLAIVNGQAVELSGDWSLGDTQLAVTNAATPDQGVPNATVDLVAPYARMYQDGNIMWVLAQDYSNNKAWLQGVDISNPSSPTLRGRLDLDPTTIGYVYGDSWSWGYGAEAVQVGHSLVLHNEFYGCYDYCGTGYTQPADTIQVIDLSNPDAPSLSPSVALSGSDWSWGLTAVGNYAWITHYQWYDFNGGWVKYYVDRIDVSDPAHPQVVESINVPGVFFSASADGKTIYTQDVEWSSNYNTATTYVNALQLLGNGVAVLTGSMSLNGYPDGAVVDGTHAYVETWNYGSTTSSASLVTIDLSQMSVTNTQQIGSSWSWLRKVAGGKLFLDASWYDESILIYDLADPANPSFQGDVQTAGWVNDIIVDGNTAYLPSGYYGVPVLDLTPGSQLPPGI